MKFKKLRELYIENVEIEKVKNHFYIENGYFESWAVENKENANPDKGLRNNLTDTRWKQYLRGEISRDKAIELAVKRYDRQIEKEIEKTLLRFDEIANAPDLIFITVDVDFVKSMTWGYNPHVTVATNNGTYYGTASGCGYDKESAAVAQAFDQDLSILKTLYTLKEKALEIGILDNKIGLGYGSGYGVIPCFERGVGVGCFWNILKKAGFDVLETYGKHENLYTLYKGVGK